MLTILRALPGQGRAHFVSREELVERRDASVRETVRYAAEHVPFYRELFRREGIDPCEIRGAEDLVRVPVVPREDVLRDPGRFRSDAPEGKDGVLLRSSGTTGEPLSLFHDRRSILLNVAYSERERALEAGLVGKRVRYTRLYLGSDQPENVDRVRGLAGQASFRPLRPRYRQASFYRSREQVCATIDDIRPDVLMGAGSALEAFYRLAVSAGGPEHRPKAILYTWDHMTTEGRRLIEETFGIPVLSRYSAMESLKIGFFCEERHGFHLHEDLCHVSIRASDGRAIADGERGEIVLSNLVNRGSVLLNYRIGDMGRITSEACVCGRTTRVLAALEGRVNDVVILPDGSLGSAFEIAAIVSTIPGIVRSQLVQRAPASFELLLATIDRAAFDQSAAKAEAAVSSLLPGCEVEAAYRDEIPLEQGRKHRPIVLLES